MRKKNKKKFIWFSVLSVVLAVFAVWVAWGNTALELNTYSVTGARLPECFDGYRIAHISDLHNAQLGQGNEELLKMLREADPDLIAITGDLVDSRNTDVEVALQFVQEAAKIAPCYYVPGNHEARINAYEELKNQMAAAGVIILTDTTAKISIGGETITLIGVNDPSFRLGEDAQTVMRNVLTTLHTDGDEYTVLLSHRPELFAVYAEQDVDLVLSGHAHGGQVRIPFLGGVIAPDQGLFPEFDGGIYTEGNTNMLVSRGIGNSLFPFRVNNRPEVILVELSSGMHGE